MNVRAKFQCSEVTQTAFGTRYRFAAVYDTTTEENRRFATATPAGDLTITVTNPAVSFMLGTAYYLDFSEIPTEAPADPAAL
jgi:hypothetical protein